MFKRALFILICLIPAAVLPQDDISITMSVNRSTVTVGDQVYLSIKVSGPQQNLPEPQLPNLTMFDLYPQGTSTNISIVNGKMEASLEYNYLLLPRKEGTFVIKPAVVVQGRKRYESNEITLTVTGSGGATPQTPSQPSTVPKTESSDIFLTAVVNKKKAYVNEQITLTIKFYHAVRLYSQPDYTPPQTTDFWTDMLEPQRTYYEVVNGRRYKIIEINTALFPTRSGDLTIGQAMVTASVPSRRRSRRLDPFSMFDDFFGTRENVTIRSKQLKVKAVPLPVEGKPGDFSGTVGKYKISSFADKTEVQVNQPVTVTYKIAGTGNIKTIAEPVIGDLKDFRVYKASTDENISKLNGIVGGTKTFEEVYIPKRAGKLTIPPVEFSFFDPAARKYNVLSTRPVIVDVKPAEEGEYADMPFRPIAGRVVDPNAKDIRYIKTDFSDLALKKPLIIFRPVYLAINVIPVFVLVFALISTRRRERLASDIRYARSSGAKKRARKRLATARKLVRSREPAKFYAEIRLAIFSYVADKLNISPHGLTSDMLLEIIKNSGAEEELLSAASSLLKRADFAQYSSVEVPQEQIMESLNMAEMVLVRLEGMTIA